MHKKVIALLLSCFLLFSFCSCGEKDPTGKKFGYAISSEPGCLDPQFANDNASFTVLNHCMEGLVQLDENGDPIAGAAEEWSVSPDGLTYTFILRQEAKWHVTSSIEKLLGENFDSRVIASDFIFALQRALDPTTKSPNASLLYGIKNARQVHQEGLSADELGISSEGDYILSVTLEEPDPDFLQLLASPVALPCNREFFNATGGRYGLESKYLMCNGGFYLSRWSHNSSLLLEKNNSYRNGTQVLPSSLTLYIASNESEIVERFQQEDTDAALISGSMLSTLKNSEDYSKIPYLNTTYSILFNQKNATLNNSNTRLALCRAINLSQLEAADYLIPAKGLVPDSLPFGDTTYREAVGSQTLIAFNPDTARQNLLQLGENNIANLNGMTMLCVENNDLKTLATYVLQSWQKHLGVYINLEIVSQTDFESRMTSGNFQLAFYPVSFQDSSLLRCMRQFVSPDNMIGLDDSSYNTYFNEITSASDSESQLSALSAAEQYLIENALLFPMFYEQKYFVFGKDVTDISFHVFGEKVDFSTAKKFD